jgi:hypothetical protein
MDEALTVLTEQIDEEILSKMPPWLRVLRDSYIKNLHQC